MSTTTPLSEIPTLTLLYKLYKLAPTSSTASDATSRFNNKISLIRTDITKLGTDAIVNAANESLLGGGGVDGAIHRAAGPKLVEECETLDGCDTGSAKITGAYRLPCRKVIHAVGPVYHATKREGLHTTLLKSCYTTSLDLAAQNDCKSIAFSALSTGVYGYPSKEAAETAIQAVKGWLEEDEERAENMERVVFCQFMEKDELAYEEFIPKYFPPADQETTDETTNATSRVSEEEATGTEEEGSHDLQESEQLSQLPDAPNEEPSTNDILSQLPDAPTKEAEGDEGGERDSTTEEVIAAQVADLPDVPTKEPTAADEPAPKKPKLDSGFKT